MSKFDVKERIDKFLYSTYNLLSDVIFGFDAKSKELVRRNEAYRGIHSGQRCFILGTGPSLSLLSDEQIAKLNPEILFGVNSLYKSGVGQRLAPKYYTMIDNLYWEDASWSSAFSEVAAKYPLDPPTFITDPRAKVVIDPLNPKKSPIYIYSKKYPTHEMSFELTDNIYAAMNCVTYSILVAMYMGFKEVYILGCDYNAFCSAGSGHCYDDKGELKDSPYNLAFYLKFYWLTTEFHYLVSKLANDNGVKVINITPSSLLDAYPRAAIESVL